MTGLLQSLFKSFLPEKIGALLLLVIGLAIAAFSFIVGFLCLIVRFVCSTLKTCRRKSSSIICGPCLYLLLLVGSFSFILTGLVVHNQTALMQSYSVDNVHLYRSDVIRKLLGVWKKGVDAITCAVDGTIGKISESQPHHFLSASWNYRRRNIWRKRYLHLLGCNLHRTVSLSSVRK